MPTYNFTREDTCSGTEIPDEKLKARYASQKKGGKFERAYLYSGKKVGEAPEEVMQIKNCEGSTVLVAKDRPDFALRKIHIGNLEVGIRHIETYAGESSEGPRADLHNFDLAYAIQRLEELKRWRDPEYREQIREHYSRHSWYSVKHRVNQTHISPEGLEEKIKEFQELISLLQTQPNNMLVSVNVTRLECMYGKLISEMEEAIKNWLTDSSTETRKVKDKKQKPNVIISPEVLLTVGEMRTTFNRVLDFVVPKIDIERASRYWQVVDSWQTM